MFSTTDGEKDYDYIPEGFLSVSVDEFYDQNDTMPAFYFEPIVPSDSESSYVTVGSGLWTYQGSGPFGECVDNLVQYEQDVPVTSCQRQYSGSQAESFSSQCTNALSVDRFVNNLKILSGPSIADLGGAADANNTVAVSLASVIYEDFATGAKTNVTSLYRDNGCGTAVLTGVEYNAQADTCSFGLSGVALAGGESVCRGLVKSADYSVYHRANALGTLMRVEAAIVITDAPFPNASDTLTYQQSNAVQFFSENVAGQSATNGNLVRRARSGNPGYLMGFPLLAGQLDTSGPDGDYINEQVSGFELPSPIADFDSADPDAFGLGLCPRNTSLPKMQPYSVRFGYDVSSGCTVKLNRVQLEQMCTSGESKYTDSAGIPYFYGSAEAST